MKITPSHLPEPPQYTARPIIKTDKIIGPWGGAGNRTRKMIPFDPIQKANLQERYGHKPRETQSICGVCTYPERTGFY